MALDFTRLTTAGLPRVRYRAALTTAIIGVAVSIAAFVFVEYSDARQAEGNFLSVARDRQVEIQSGLNGYQDAVGGLRLFFEATNEDISFAQFRTFSDRLRARYIGIQAFAWAPRVTREEREAFEAKARAAVRPDYQITDDAFFGRPVRAGDRAVYFPTLYGTVEPGFEKIFGADVLSGPQAADYLQAEASGKFVARGPMPLITVQNGTAWGYIVLAAVYPWNAPHATVAQRQANIRGFVAGVIRIRSALSAILREIGLPRNLDMYFFTPNTGAGQRLLFSYLAAGPGTETAVPTTAALGSGPHWRGTLKVATQDLDLIITPASPLFSVVRDWRALLVLLSGLALTGITALYLALTVLRTARLVALTDRLQETSSELRREAQEHQSANQQLRRRDAILGAVAASATNLLEQGDLPQVISAVLERVATAAGVGYAYLLGDRRAAQGPAVAELRAEWQAHDLSPARRKPILQYLDGRAAGLIRWAIQLGDGNPVAALVRDLPPAERAILGDTGLKSIVAMPVMVNDQWWGEIGIGDFAAEHLWSDAEIDALRTLAELIGTAIARARYVKALADANTIVENSPTILYRVAGEPALPMIYISHNIVKFGYDPAQFVAWPGFYRTIAHPEDQEKVQDALARALEKSTESSTIEYRLRTGTGVYRWVENRLTPVRDAGGRLIEIEGIITDITERKAAEERIAVLARTDSLTGLANRATFVDRLHQAFSASKRGANPFSVLYIDLDHFKDINDTLGHPLGDRLLKAVGERLTANVRDTDVVARLGGDEFAVLQMEVGDTSNSAALAAKLHDALGGPYAFNSHNVHVTASVGVAPFQPETVSPDDMLAQADLALYRAKEDGRDQYRFHSDDLDRQVRERVSLANDLRQAIVGNALQLYYQPQVELVSGTVVGMEALARWNHPIRGQIGPRLFIPVAEKTGLILPFGRWILDGACRQMKAWRDADIAPPVVAVNISIVQLKNGRDFVRDVTSTLRKYGLQPGDLELDVTEFVLAQATLAQNDILSELREIGVKIAMDDFGTEYSSFDYLRTYGVNHLKIAQSFVEGATQDRDRAATIRAIIGLARELGVGVIAEGVETAEQRALLIKIGSETEGQGFFFSEAVPAARAEEILKEGRISGRSGGAETLPA